MDFSMSLAAKSKALPSPLLEKMGEMEEGRWRGRGREGGEGGGGKVEREGEGSSFA